MDIEQLIRQAVRDEAVSVFQEMRSIKEANERPEIIIKSQTEMCSFLAITEPTIIRWRKKGKIPFIQIGSSIRYDLTAVIKALSVGNNRGVKNG